MRRKMIDYHLGGRLKACPYCTRTTDEAVKAQYSVTVYHCICPHHFGDDEGRQIVTEACSERDYQVCPLPKRLKYHK